MDPLTIAAAAAAVWLLVRRSSTAPAVEDRPTRQRFPTPTVPTPTVPTVPTPTVPTRPHIPTPTVPTVPTPSIALTRPDLSRYEVPGFDAPTLRPPDLSRYEVPGFDAPTLRIPDLSRYEVPGFDAPTLRIPDLSRYEVPGFDAPTLRPPDLSRYEVPQIITDAGSRIRDSFGAADVTDKAGTGLLILDAMRSKDSYQIATTTAGVAAGAVGGTAAAPLVGTFYLVGEFYRRIFGFDSADKIRSLFGQDRLSQIRKAERKASRARADNQKSYADEVALFMRQHQVVSITLLEDLYHAGGYRDLMDRLRSWATQAPPGVLWLHLDPSVWSNIDSEDPEEQIASLTQLFDAGLDVVE